MRKRGVEMCRTVPSPGLSGGRTSQSVVFAASACFGLAALGGWSRAEACATAGPPMALLGYPEGGAVGVPTDVIPVYETPSLGYPSPTPQEPGPAEFHLRRIDGEEVPLVATAPYQ